MASFFLSRDTCNAKSTELDLPGLHALIDYVLVFGVDAPSNWHFLRSLENGWSYWRQLPSALAETGNDCCSPLVCMQTTGRKKPMEG